MNEKAIALRSTVCGVLFLVVATAICHVLFSWMGFNPTDDGVVLAASRRICDGEVPHRDFISIRPVGSSILHLPWLLLGGDRCIWLARLFVWFEFAAIAWAWTSIVNIASGRRFSDLEKVLLALTGMALSAHTFPVMPWTTVDGLFLVSVGLWLCVRCTGVPWKMAGYVLVGAACLCRQPFVAILPAALLLLGDWRRVWCWLACAAPLAAYVLYLAGMGAIEDAMIQFAARSEILQTGLYRYFFQPEFACGVIYGFIAMWMILDHIQVRMIPPRSSLFLRLVGMSALYLLVAYCVWSMGCKESFGSSFALVGGALGCTSCVFLLGRTQDLPVDRPSSVDPLGATVGESDATAGRLGATSGLPSTVETTIPQANCDCLPFDAFGRLLAIGSLALAIAWCASLSLGYNSPALASSLVVPLLAAYGGMSQRTTDIASTGHKLRIALTVALAIASVYWFYIGRTQFIYRDRPAAELNKSLDGVFPGARRIQTSDITFLFLSDLREAVRQCGAKEHAVIPNLAAHWIRSPQRNPLSIDWAFEGELPTKPLMDRVIRDLDARRGSVMVIVQKMNAAALGGRESAAFSPCADVRDHVVNTWRQVGETRFFVLYE